jgi:hypothetical protein
MVSASRLGSPRLGDPPLEFRHCVNRPRAVALPQALIEGHVLAEEPLGSFGEGLDL